MKNFLKRNISISVLCAIVSLYTLLAYHYPFFRLVVNNVEGGVNGWLITCGLLILMLATNYMICYIFIYLLRVIGRWIVGLSLICDAIALYFINTYDVLITDSMMGNVFNTRYSEASGFFSWVALVYIVLLGVLPCAYVVTRKVDYSSLKKFSKRVSIAFVVMLAMVGANVNNFTWIDHNAPKLGSLIMPWSYVVNTFRHISAEKKRNAKEILLPDATIATKSKDVVVLIIGESARRENFSLYGYNKKTNPLLEQQDVVALKAKSSATYTTAGVKAILDHKATDKLYEILPNYLNRAGVDVIWRTANWGEPPVHIEKYLRLEDLMAAYPEEDEKYDGILTAGLKETIESSEADKLFIVLHTSTSHGPIYYSKYPVEFETFTPVCTTVEMSQADPAELMNAYDNTIVYTDFIVDQVIKTLKAIDSRRCAMLFVSDHGESLGENNLYMHGVPMAIAPKEQIEIPFIVWSSEGVESVKPLGEVGHFHTFHSVLNFLGIESQIYDPEMSVFK